MLYFIALLFGRSFNSCDARSLTPGAHQFTSSPVRHLTFPPAHLLTWATGHLGTHSHTNCFLSQSPSETSALKGQRPCVLFGIYLRLLAARFEKKGEKYIYIYIYICDTRNAFSESHSSKHTHFLRLHT